MAFFPQEEEPIPPRKKKREKKTPRRNNTNPKDTGPFSGFEKGGLNHGLYSIFLRGLDHLREEKVKCTG